jgi:hypothetical protein
VRHGSSSTRSAEFSFTRRKGHNFVITDRRHHRFSMSVNPGKSSGDLQKLLQFFLCDLVLLEIKVEEVGIKRSGIGFVIRIVICLQVRVRETLFHGDSIGRSD